MLRLILRLWNGASPGQQANGRRNVETPSTRRPEGGFYGSANPTQSILNVASKAYNVLVYVDEQLPQMQDGLYEFGDLNRS